MIRSADPIHRIWQAMMISSKVLAVVCALLALADVTSAAAPDAGALAAIPAAVRELAFNPEKPDSVYFRYRGGPGGPKNDKMTNGMGIGRHSLWIWYDHGEVSIKFEREDGSELKIDVGKYDWPTIENTTVAISIFTSTKEKEVLVCVGGVPVAVIFIDTLQATCTSATRKEDPFFWKPEALQSFEKPR